MSGGQWATLEPTRRILIVVRTFTALDRLLSVLDCLGFGGDAYFEIDFTIEPGSHFAAGLPRHLAELGVRELPWDTAVRSPGWDLILAAHASAELRHLTGPLVVMSHGAGHPRMVPLATSGGDSPTGLARSQLVHDGRLIPDLICLSHGGQLRRLLKEVPEAEAHVLIVGDPVMDQIRASQDRRNHYRRLLGVEAHQRLVVVSTTWGIHSTIGVAPNLLHRLVAALPSDSYRVALVRHWNLEKAHSEFGVTKFLSEAQIRGLIVIPPVGGWQAGLIAGDIILGDHGSVTVFGAGLDKPVLLVSDGGPEVDPESANAELWEHVVPLAVHGDLRSQIEMALRQHTSGRLRVWVDHILGNPGHAWHDLSGALHRLLGLGDRPIPRMRQVDEPPRFEPPQDRSHWVTAKVVADSGNTGSVELERYPDVLGTPPAVGGDPFLVADVQGDCDPILLSNAEIICNSEILSEQDGRVWMSETMSRYHNAVSAFRLQDGCVVRFHDGTVLRSEHLDTTVAAAALYAWRVAGHSTDDVVNLKTHVGTKVFAIGT